MADVATSQAIEGEVFDGKAAYRAFRGGCHRQNKLIESEKLSIDHTECIGWIHLSIDVVMICRMLSTFSLRCASPLDLRETREASASRFATSAMRGQEQPRVGHG